ncbi:TPA: hypothetical protein DDW35_03125, partial [Candidatus Sumerlaeota bacterium]|nr:hypothetical protein [Candidatus Sumerlaeota bacterium]
HNHETFTTLKGNWIAVLPTEDDLHSLTGLSPSAKEYSLDKLMTKKGWEEIHQHSVSKLATLVVYKWARFFSPSTFFETPTVFHKGIKVVLLGFNALVLLAFVF